MAFDDASTIAPDERCDTKSVDFRSSFSKDSFIFRDDETLVSSFEGYDKEKQSESLQRPTLKRKSLDDQYWVSWALPGVREHTSENAIGRVRKALVKALTSICDARRRCAGSSSSTPRPITTVDSTGLSLADYIAIVDREFSPAARFSGQLLVLASHLQPPSDCITPDCKVHPSIKASQWAERVHAVVAERVSERYEHRITALSVHGTHDILIHWAQLSRESPYLRRVSVNLEHPDRPWSATLDLDSWDSESDGNVPSSAVTSVPVPVREPLPAPALHVTRIPLHHLDKLQSSAAVYMSIPWAHLAHLSLSVVIAQQRFCSYNTILHCISNLKSLQSLSITLTHALPSYSSSDTVLAPWNISFTPPAEPIRLPHLHSLELEFPLSDYHSASFVETAFDLPSLARLRIARGAQDERRPTAASKCGLQLAKLLAPVSALESLSLAVRKVDVNDLMECLGQCVVRRIELALFDATHLVSGLGALGNGSGETGVCTRTPLPSAQIIRLHSAVWNHVKVKLGIDQRRLLRARIGRVCGEGSTSLNTVKAFREKTSGGDASAVLEEVWEKELNGERMYFVNVFRVLLSNPSSFKAKDAGTCYGSGVYR
ncbi:hypothetical protein CONPUDRAFT_140154 [Coniophora puteana RWD-64-598 SS2]|uniref:Uncharacterized protein n=1 Tax=Coniophora puteana (strain RWD-64-598) TaxID=741705 RepID=A0A5M3M7J9_CONPW|nr:uncharacterized protein CONPUDRAFT_140154 [Coniophora puteana RWD-64-598 SS2]EIW75208.1 hypothetical protein CONPUDRAFT_140154 [Coniophora puteana RWD-64-598 SS2]